jgi:4-hydroxybenzoyl-CoA thioesterase
MFYRRWHNLQIGEALCFCVSDLSIRTTEGTNGNAPRPERTRMLTNRRTIVIEFGDCDPAGVVYYPRYFAYFNACTDALFEHGGLPREMRENKYQIIGTPLVDVRARFIAPLRYGETAVIESCMTEFRESSFQVQHKLYKGKELAVEAFETRVWAVRSAADPKKTEGKPIPPDVIKRFSEP